MQSISASCHIHFIYPFGTHIAAILFKIINTWRTPISLGLFVSIFFIPDVDVPIIHE